MRLTVDRWDLPAGTLLRVETVRSTADPWRFTVALLMPGSVLPRPYGLNFFEEDLAQFEPFDGPIPRPAPYERPSRGSARRKERSPQLFLPFADGDIG